MHLIKGANPIFQNLVLYFEPGSPHQRYEFKISVINWSNRLDLESNFVYCSCLFTVSFICHIFQTQHFSAMKFYMGSEKNISFL